MSGAANDSEQAQQFSDVEPDRETRMGGSLAPLDRHHSEEVDYGPARFRTGMATS